MTTLLQPDSLPCTPFCPGSHSHFGFEEAHCGSNSHFRKNKFCFVFSQKVLYGIWTVSPTVNFSSVWFFTSIPYFSYLLILRNSMRCRNSRIPISFYHLVPRTSYNQDCFLEQVSVHSETEGKAQGFTTCLCTPSPLSRSPATVVHLLQLTNPHWHIAVAQSPQFTWRLTLGVHSVCLDEHIMTWISHYGTIQRTFTALNILCALPIHPICTPLHLFPASGNHWFFYWRQSFDISCTYHSLFIHSPTEGHLGCS